MNEVLDEFGLVMSRFGRRKGEKRELLAWLLAGEAVTLIACRCAWNPRRRGLQQEVASLEGANLSISIVPPPRIYSFHFSHLFRLLSDHWRFCRRAPPFVHLQLIPSAHNFARTSSFFSTNPRLVSSTPAPSRRLLLCRRCQGRVGKHRRHRSWSCSGFGWSLGARLGCLLVGDRVVVDVRLFGASVSSGTLLAAVGAAAVVGVHGQPTGGFCVGESGRPSFALVPCCL